MPSTEAFVDEIARSALLKIERAKKHITDLNSEISKFLAAGGCKTVLRSYPEQNRRSVGVKTDATGMRKIGLVIGDAVHNLRSSLDVLAVAMVGQFGGTSEGVHFPFPKKAEGLQGAISGGKIHLGGPEVIKIIENLKPYPGGNDLLCALHQFDIIDKHGIIIPIGSVVTLDSTWLKLFVPDFPSNVDIQGAKYDSLMNAISWGPYLPASRPRVAIELLEQEIDINASFAITFRGDQPLGGHMVLVALHDLVNVAAAIVRDVSVAAARLKNSIIA